MAYWYKCSNCQKISVSASPVSKLVNRGCPYCGRILPDLEITAHQANPDHIALNDKAEIAPTVEEKKDNKID
ncbi:MAG: hypothetical protein A4E55_02388 [Pelotomaculum sp. PtaU1.Bin035]|nr:MAG: hypothetical protein A4E55_02388 [Pelotomaculum sp. PtaU1.Bin035]